MMDDAVERHRKMALDPDHQQSLEDLYTVIDELWGAMTPDLIDQLDPKTAALCQIIHERVWHG